VAAFQRLHAFFIGAVPERIEIAPDRTSEKGYVLANDCLNEQKLLVSNYGTSVERHCTHDARSQVFQANSRNIDAVNAINHVNTTP
jgi:hypothetical protein